MLPRPSYPRALAARFVIAATLVLCAACSSGGAGRPQKAAAGGAPAKAVKMAEPTLEEVLAGGIGNLRLGLTLPGDGSKHPLFGTGFGSADPRLARLEVWTSERGRVEFLAAVFHERAGPEAAAAVSTLGLVPGAVVGELPGRYRPRRGLGRGGAYYTTRVELRESGRAGVWIGYEDGDPEKLYGLYRGSGAEAAARTIARAAEQRERDLLDPGHWLYHERRWNETWPQLAPKWQAAGQLADVDQRAVARLGVLAELHPVYEPLSKLYDYAEQLGSIRSAHEELRKAWRADALEAAKKGPAARRWIWAQVFENRDLADDPARVYAALEASPALDLPRGLVAQRQAVEAARLGPREGKEGADARKEMESAAIERGRSGKHPVLVGLEQLERDFPSPYHRAFEALHRDVEVFVGLGNLEARLAWLRGEAKNPARNELSAQVRAAAKSRLAAVVEPEVRQRVDALGQAGRWAGAVRIALEAHSAGIGRWGADSDLRTAVAEGGHRRFGAALCVYFDPHLAAVDGRDGAARSRLEEPPYLDRALHTHLGLFPAGVDDLEGAANALGLAVRWQTLVPRGEDLALEPAVDGPMLGLAFRSFDWLDGLYSASPELRAESQRLKEWRERNDAALKHIRSEEEAVASERTKVERQTQAVLARFQGRNPTAHEMETVVRPAAAAETVFNERVKELARKQSRHDSEIREFNLAVSAYNIGLNLERTKHYRAERDRLDRALVSHFDRRLAEYREQLVAKGMAQAEVDAELADVAWLLGRAAAPAQVLAPEVERVEVARRRLVYLEREIWRMDTAPKMAKALREAFAASARVEPDLQARRERMRPHVERYVRGFEIQRLRAEADYLPEADRAELLGLMGAVKLD